MIIKINRKLKSQLKQIGQIAQKNDARAYLVGGPVRDLLCAKQSFDLDIAIEPNGDSAKFINELSVKFNANVISHKRFGTFIITLPNKSHIDFATTRVESYAKPGALPEVKFACIENDLSRRDFSINAIALSINPSSFGAIIDPFGGVLAVKNKTLQVLHNLSFQDDPTRIFRLARFASRGFNVEKNTLKLAKTHCKYIKNISSQRIKNEILAILKEENSAYALNLLSKIGAILKISDYTAKIKNFNFLNSGKCEKDKLLLLIKQIGSQNAEKFLQELCFSKKNITLILASFKKIKTIQLLNGADLKKLKIKPGPIYKQIFTELLKRNIKTKKVAIKFVKSNYC